MRSRTLLLSLAAALSLALLMAACLARPPMQTVDLTVQAAQRACQNIPDIERFGCIEQHAVATLNFGAPADNFSPQIEWGRGADWLRSRSIPNPGPATVTPQDDAAVAVNVWQVPRRKER